MHGILLKKYNKLISYMNLNTFTKTQFLKADMSPRTYYRVFDNNKTYVLMDSKECVKQFVYLSNYLINHGIKAPKVIAQEDNKLLLEDFGDKTLTAIFKESLSQEKILYEKALDILFKIHENHTPDANIETYSLDLYLKEVNVFSDYYYTYHHKKNIEPSIAKDFESLWRKAFEHVEPLTPKTLVLRDYHVDNLMFLDSKELGILDFQDAVFGSVVYDFISLLEDARRALDPSLKKHLKHHFLSFFDKSTHVDMLYTADVLGAGRHAKVLGVFTRYLLLHKKNDKIHHLNHVMQLFKEALIRAELSEITYFLKDQGFD